MGKTEADAVSITNKRHAGKTVSGVSKHTGNKYNLIYDKDGFPIFESKYDMKISNELLGNGKPKSHFKAANKQLREDLLKNPKLKDEMNLTNEQYKYFTEGKLKNGAPKELTWHHHQDTGKMELVDYDIHDTFKHTGGMSIWGGGY